MKRTRIKAALPLVAFAAVVGAIIVMHGSRSPAARARIVSVLSDERRQTAEVVTLPLVQPVKARLLNEEDCLKYNYDSFVKIALSRQSQSKAWLRGFLEGCKDTPEKRSLQQLLAP